MSNEKVLLRLKTARGQIDAVIKMIEEDRYCIDIANQLLAIQSLIKNANNEVLTNHLNHCVKNAINEHDADQKIDEIVKLLHADAECRKLGEQGRRVYETRYTSESMYTGYKTLIDTLFSNVDK